MTTWLSSLFASCSKSNSSMHSWIPFVSTRDTSFLSRHYSLEGYRYGLLSSIELTDWSSLISTLIVLSSELSLSHNVAAVWVQALFCFITLLPLNRMLPFLSLTPFFSPVLFCLAFLLSLYLDLFACSLLFCLPLPSPLSPLPFSHPFPSFLLSPLYSPLHSSLSGAMYVTRGTKTQRSRGLQTW